MNAQKFIIEANKQEVCRLLGMSELVYCQFQQQQGLEYLAKMLGVGNCGQSALESNKLFWRWWVNHWNQRDAEFLTYAKGAPWRMRLRFYQSLHSIDGFEFYPHRNIMEESYRLLNEMVIPMVSQEVLC